MTRIKTRSAGIGSVIAELNREIGSVERTVSEREEFVRQQTQTFDDPVMRALIGDVLEA